MCYRVIPRTPFNGTYVRLVFAREKNYAFAFVDCCPRGIKYRFPGDVLTSSAARLLTRHQQTEGNDGQNRNQGAGPRQGQFSHLTPPIWSWVRLLLSLGQLYRNAPKALTAPDHSLGRCFFLLWFASLKI